MRLPSNYNRKRVFLSSAAYTAVMLHAQKQNQHSRVYDFQAGMAFFSHFDYFFFDDVLFDTTGMCGIFGREMFALFDQFLFQADKSTTK